MGIRPEGFIVDENGPLICKLSGVEVMGRDSSIISTHKACLNTNAVIRSIIDTDCIVDTDRETVRFSVAPHKVDIFSKETEERIGFEVEA